MSERLKCENGRSVNKSMRHRHDSGGARHQEGQRWGERRRRETGGATGADLLRPGCGYHS